MFGNKDKPMEPGLPARPSPSPKRDGTVIGDGANFNGNLNLKGDILINGVFEGTIACTGALVVGKSGRVKGEVEAHEATISGRIEGRVTAQERVHLQTGSHVEGDIHAKSFMIQDGVFFQGNCSMGEPKSQSRVPMPDSEGNKPDLGILKQS
jgi:cytoskeletal protein CcmA (bactofilin family)